MGFVLIRRKCSSEPGVVGDVQEQVGSLLSIRSGEWPEDRFVADHASSLAEWQLERARRAAASESAEVLETREPARIDEGNALDDRHEITLAVRGLSANVAEGVGQHRGVEVVVVERLRPSDFVI